MVKSMCKCGHTGDCAPGDKSQHGGLIGHGPCSKCKCSKFTWSKWTKTYESELAYESEMQRIAAFGRVT